MNPNNVKGIKTQIRRILEKMDAIPDSGSYESVKLAVELDELQDCLEKHSVEFERVTPKIKVPFIMGLTDYAKSDSFHPWTRH